MILTWGPRNLVLTAHVTSSIGWLGAVACFLALAIAGMTGGDAQMVRAVYLAMKLTTWFVIVPLAFVSLVSGIMSSLGTCWGLLGHYWVLLKLLITIPATIVLLIHTRPIDRLAAAASEAGLRDQQVMMVYASGAAAVVLLVAITLSVYKPRGVTPYGWRTKREPRSSRP